MNFKKDHIELGVRNGPTIKLPITSLQANAFVVEHNTSKTKSKHYANNNANTHLNTANKVMGYHKYKTKIDTNLLHDRIHCSGGVFATIQAHNLWQDVNITQGFYSICTLCKIMTIPATLSGKLRQSILRETLDEIQVDTVRNPEPIGVSYDSRYKYFLILCD